MVCGLGLFSAKPIIYLTHGIVTNYILSGQYIISIIYIQDIFNTLATRRLEKKLTEAVVFSLLGKQSKRVRHWG